MTKHCTRRCFHSKTKVKSCFIMRTIFQLSSSTRFQKHLLLVKSNETLRRNCFPLKHHYLDELGNARRQTIISRACLTVMMMTVDDNDGVDGDSDDYGYGNDDKDYGVLASFIQTFKQLFTYFFSFLSEKNSCNCRENTKHRST